MPYYPEGKELEDACKQLRLYSRCSECGGQLEVLYDMTQHREYIVCREDDKHEGIRKIRPDILKEKREVFSMDSVALMKLDKPGMVARIEQAKWPAALKPEEKALIATVALSYGLDPILQELSLFQGRPYPTVNAWYRKSQETGQFDGMDSRPANKKEREERNAKEGDLLYRCEVYRKGGSHPFVGWGKVFAAERQGNEHLPIVKWSDRMAEKRAEMQAMRKAFSIPMPTMAYEELTEVEGLKVNQKTGEIIEGESREIEPEPSPEATESTSDTTKEEGNTELFPDSIINISELNDSLIELRKKDEKTWSEGSLLSYMRLAYKGVEGNTVYEIASKLNQGQSKHFTKTIQDALDKV